MAGEIVREGKFDPDVWAVPGAKEGSVDRKFPAAASLYPSLNDYARVDVARYLSAEHMAREKATLWARAWTVAGRVSDVPSPGSYFRYDLGAESFIVMRGRDTEIRAFYNACQHRGRQLIDNDFGTRPTFVCPFHSWTYDLTGKNLRVTDREVFSERALCGDLNLKRVRCETWGGFVFVNQNLDAPPLLDFLSDIPELMLAYRMEDMHVVKDTVLPIDCNWKIALEAFLESYHLHMTHPQAMPVTEDVQNQLDVFRNGHARHATPLAVPSFRLSDRKTITPLLQFMLADAGLDPQSFPGDAGEVRGAVQAAKRHPGNRYGIDYSRFTDSQITDDWNYFIFPNMTLNTHPEGVLIMRFLPHPTDPGKSYYHVHVVLPKLKAGCKAPFYMGVKDDVDISGGTRPARRHTTLGNPEMGDVLEQDLSNMEGVQRGLQSRGFPGGMRYAEHEQRIQVLHAEIDKYLRGAK